MRYIHKIYERYIYEYENPRVGKAELWDFSKANKNEEARIEAVTTVASISYGNEKAKDPEKLWNLLIEKGHESVFEFIRYGSMTLRDTDLFYNMNSMPLCSIATFKLKVPIFVARQIMRHRSFSYMEMSRRYVKGNKVKLEFWKKRNPYNVWFEIDNEEFTVDLEEISIGDFLELSEVIYQGLLKKGYKPEQARAFLPLGLYTQFWMQGDYKAWLNFFIYRLHPEAQEETRLVAKAMWHLLEEWQPEIIGAMESYIEEWIKDCNPVFIPSREKKAEWFTENWLS